MTSLRSIYIAVASCLLLVPAPISLCYQNGELVLSTEEEIKQDVALTPCKDGERLNAAKSLFIKVGAQAEDIVVEKLDDVENLVLRKPGKSQDTIIVGAHYDKTRDGCGALDNWTGIVSLAHIYRSLKNVALQKSVIFVAFGKEEKGMLGSKAMVKRIKKEEREQYCAMVNIDSLGMAAPQVPENLSSAALVNRITELAQRMKIPFNKGSIPDGQADSLPFIDNQIPAITITALGQGWGEVLHTRNDQVSKVNSTSVYLGYRLALALVAELDRLPCDVSRESEKTK